MCAAWVAGEAGVDGERGVGGDGDGEGGGGEEHEDEEDGWDGGWCAWGRHGCGNGGGWVGVGRTGERERQRFFMEIGCGGDGASLSPFVLSLPLSVFPLGRDGGHRELGSI